MYLTKDVIPPENFLGHQEFKAGANVLFLGRIRDGSEGRKVLYLEYEAYQEMAERMIRDLIHEAQDQWPLEKIQILHRLGKVELGQIAVGIEVQAIHRDEAYQASRFLIEGIKHKVPIWKKETFEDGTSAWTRCPPRQRLNGALNEGVGC